MHQLWHGVLMVQHGLLCHIRCISILNLPLAHPVWTTMETYKTPYKVRKYNMRWCRDTWSFYIFLVTGECWKKVPTAVLLHNALRNEFIQLCFFRPCTGVANFLSKASFHRHSAFASDFLYWLRASLRFSCQSFRSSVFVPRSLASNLKTIATNNNRLKLS